MSPSRIIPIVLVASALLVGVLGLAFVFALGNRLLGFILLLVAAADLAMAAFFARKGPA
ncbi:MAG TPA: hypothetical protein VLA95_06460 [Gemmatimonadales bacterium]|nr:hypothetical protein [Gemmatimonadales bacterium]